MLPLSALMLCRAGPFSFGSDCARLPRTVARSSIFPTQRYPNLAVAQVGEIRESTEQTEITEQPELAGSDHFRLLCPLRLFRNLSPIDLLPPIFIGEYGYVSKAAPFDLVMSVHFAVC